jgi:hypothetical protein
MPALKDARREKFAQLIERGWTLEKAHRMAGYPGDPGNAWRLQRQDDIQLRIGELAARRADSERIALARAQRKLDLSTERALKEYANIAFANMLDYVELDNDGVPHFDIAAITRDQGAAIEQLTIDEYADGRGPNARQVKRVRVKLASKTDALGALGRHLGLFVDPSVLNVNVQNYFSEAPPSMAEWKREIELTAQAPSNDGANDGIGQTVPGNNHC